MNVLLADLDKEIDKLPPAQLPHFIGLLGILSAKAQLRLMTRPAPVVNKAEDLLTVRDVAKRLNLSADTVYELCRQGKVQSQKLGKAVRVTPSAVADYLTERGA